MDLTPYVDQLRRELVLAAEPGGEEARALAERLTAPLESSLRLALLSALSAAAEEITSQLAPGSVDVRLRGIDIGFVVTPPPHDEPGAGGPASADGDRAFPTGGAPDADDGGTARITLRLAENLKARIEEAASREGFSVNSWLVRAVAAALDRGGPEAARGPGDRRRNRWSGQHFEGWVR